jgi:type II secretory pathway pseudopilin PulG
MTSTTAEPGVGASPRRLGSASADSGFSVVEVVMSIVIMSLVLVPSLNAVFSNVRASQIVRESAQVETVLQNALDRVNRAPKRCDYTIYAQAAAQTEGWQATQATVEVWHYVPGPNPGVAGTWASGGCVGSTPTDLLVQKVAVTVTGPSGSVQRRIEMVKSDV